MHTLCCWRESTCLETTQTLQAPGITGNTSRCRRRSQASNTAHADGMFWRRLKSSFRGIQTRNLSTWRKQSQFSGFVAVYPQGLSARKNIAKSKTTRRVLPAGYCAAL